MTAPGVTAIPGTRLYEALNPGGSVVTDVTGSPETALETLEQQLRGDALGVVAVPFAQSVAMHRALRQSPLRARAWLTAWPTASDPVRLVAHDRRALRMASSGGRPLPATGRAVLRIPGSGFAARLLPTVAVLQAAGGNYGRWLTDVLPRADPRAIVLRRRGEHGAVVQAWGAAGDLPVGWVKCGGIGGEARAQERVVSGARGLGVQVPEVIARAGDCLALSHVPGRPAAMVLERDPARARVVLLGLCHWLAAWHRRAAAPRPLEPRDVERHVGAPLACLAAVLPGRYADWLLTRCRDAMGETTAFAPAHQDLTMLNVLVEGTELGVVDWETASEVAPPLIDLPYAMADAVDACHRSAGRVAAFRDAFDPAQRGMGGLVQSLLTRTAQASGASPSSLSLAFHACWLSHAVNDLERNGAGGEFVQIAQAVAAEPRRYDPFGR